MKTIIKILPLILLVISCQTEEPESVNSSLNIPERFIGDYTGIVTGYSAKIEKHKITLETEEGREIRVEGETILDNEGTHFEAKLPNNEKLVLLKSDVYVGVTLFRDDRWVISEFYLKD